MQDKILAQLAQMSYDKRQNTMMNATVSTTVNHVLNNVENDKIKLVADNVEVVKKYEHDDLAKQKDIADKQQVFSDEIRADLKLISKETGEVIDTALGVKIAEIPKVTDRMTYLIKGNEYQTSMQPRLKSGVYTKTQSNGEISSYFNVDKTVDFDRGFNNDFRIDFEPESKIFSMRYGGKKIPLLSTLKALGVSSRDLEAKWGKEVLDENERMYGRHEERDIKKLYSAVFGKEPGKDEKLADLSATIKERLFDTRLNPEVTSITLGKAYDKVNGSAILDASKKIIDINRGVEDEDDRESLMFKNIVGIETHIKERLVKSSKQIANNIAHKLGKTGKINSSISSQMFRPYIEGVITGSQISNPPNQTNIMSIIGESTKITPMGEGGIGSANAITDSMRVLSNTEAGFVDPLHTPEGGGIGISKHLSNGTVVVEGTPYSTFINRKSGKKEMKSPSELYSKYLSFPDQFDSNGKPKNKKVSVIHKGKMTTVDASEVDYVIPSSEFMFDTAAASIPFLDSIQGNRGLTASKMQEQSVSLTNREKPLFNIMAGNGKSLSKALGSSIAVPKSPVDGVVENLTDELMVIKGKDGKSHEIQLYHNFSLNSESFLNNDPLVKIGDKVEKGQILADNNFTKDGHVALGANLRVAYMPYRGWNYEDSAVISESGAKKLQSQHMYDFKARRSSGGTFDKKKFAAYYPEETSSKTMAKLDANGIIKVGQKVEHGDILIAHMEPVAPTADDIAVGRLDKQLKRDMANNSVKWDKGHVGIVTSVTKHGNNVVVNVKTKEDMKKADKIAGLHGNKHIISEILPDDQMPFDPVTGKHIELTMSPIGVSNRINTSQLLENAAGKIAEKTGKQYEIHNFEDTDNSRKVMRALKANGLSDKDKLINPETGKPFKSEIANGVSHILKLEHTIDHKFSSRYRGGYDSNEQASSGGHHGGKNVGRMESAALLARGATANLEEIFGVKGQRNDEYWRNMEMGIPTPTPKSPAFVWDKFLAMSKGAGVNIERKGKSFTMKPMTDEDIMKISAGELTRPTETYRKKNFEPVNGGLFDPKIVGGMRGDKYSHIQLPESILNPITAKAVAGILEMPESRLEAIAEGTQFISKKTGENVSKGHADGYTANEAIKSLLKNIDLDKEYEQAKKQSELTHSTADLNKLNRKMNYIKGLKKNGLEAKDLMISKVLVTPSKFRPMIQMGADGTVIIADENELYQQVAQTSKALEDHKDAMNDLPKSVLGITAAEGRGQLYKDVRALQGLSEPTAYLHKIKKKKGFLAQIDGGDKQTKEGYYQNKVMERRQDLVGRSTITLNPSLGGDQMGIPEEMATDIFRPFIMQKLVSWGYKPLDAKKQVDDDSSVFKKAREVVAGERLIIANRAPSLHKWNMTAFHPVLTKGKSIETPAVVISKNFDGDFDGDTFQIHVPVSKKALEEAYTMLPSVNMLKTGYGSVLNMPDMDMIAGAYLASKGEGSDGKVHEFKTLEEMQKAIKSHKIDHSDMVKIGKRTDNAIMHDINSTLPEKFHKWGHDLNKKNVEKWIADVSENGPKGTGLDLADKIKEVGNDYITKFGLTLGVSDTLVDTEKRDDIVKKAWEKAKTEGVVSAFSWAKEEAKNELASKHGIKSQVGIPLISGAGKGIGNTSDIAMFPGILADANDNPIEIPILRSYSEGLDTFGYWAAAHGARGGNIKKSVQSFKPGYLTKKMINTMYETRIASEVPMDTEGVEYKVSDKKGIVNRYLAQDAVDKKGKVVAKRNDLIDAALINKFHITGTKKIYVQSPLTDPTPGEGFSAWSYGVSDNNRRMNRGDHVGVISAHTITQPSLNLAMKSFHSGGKIDAKSAKRKVNTGSAFDEMDRVFSFVQTPPDKATLAKIDGVVESVNQSGVGGFDVVISGTKHYVSKNVDTEVKVGDKVKKGQQISTGTPNPHEVLSLRGMKETQKYLVEKLSDINEGNLDKRNIETIVRSITNTTRITDPGKSDYVKGDTVALTTVEHLNKNGLGIKHSPFLVAMGIGGKPALSKDFIGRLGHNRLKDVFQDGSVMGYESKIDRDSGNPMTRLVSGVYE